MAKTLPVLISITTAAPESPRYPAPLARKIADSSASSAAACNLESIFVIRLLPAIALIFFDSFVTISLRLTRKVLTPGVPRK